MAGISEILDRHRQDWDLVVELKNEALQHRSIDAKKAVEMMEFARLTAEVLKIQQEGECKSYGIDDSVIELIRLTRAEIKKRMQDR